MKRSMKSHLTSQQLTMMIQNVFNTKEKEYTCEDCYSKLDEYVDTVLAGEQPTDDLLLVEDHLSKCMDCREENEILLFAIKRSPRFRRR